MGVIMFKELVEAKTINDQGYAVINVNKRPYQIANLLPGETAEVAFFDNGYGKVEKLITKSDARQKPKCPWFAVCGGCQLQHIAYETQLEMKERRLKALLAASGVDEKTVLPIIGMKDPYNYRNKSQMIISEKGKKIMAGLYEENTHNIVNVDYCPIQNDKANEIIKTARKLIQDQNIKPYDEKRNTGLIRYLFVRIAEATGQVLVAIVTAEEKFPGRNNFVKALRIFHPEITTIIQNVNSRQTSIVLGEFERVLYGIGHIEDELLGKKFLISARTFYQINHHQTQILYRKILELAKPKGTDTVLDIYSGIGTIGMCFAEHAKQVIAVEASKASVHNGILNAKQNKIRNIRFQMADALDYLHNYAEKANTADIVIVDPPREGLTKQVVNAIVAIKPSKLVYVSCNPETLAADIREFMLGGYTVKKALPIDMFPQTIHVETISLLSLK